MTITRLRIASRASPLAIAQTKQVVVAAARLQMSYEIIKTETAGDTVAGSLADIGGKELFIGGLRELLLQNAADCAVHSLKDMAAEKHADFMLAAVGFAEDRRDVLLSAEYPALSSLPTGATVGTCSPRRAALLARYASQVSIVPMRGNIQTRLRKLDGGECVGLILAAAGLRRLGFIPDSNSVARELTGEFADDGRRFYYEYLPTAQFIPAAGQGMLAVECLAAHPLLEKLRQLSDADCLCCATAERMFVSSIGGDCHTPLGAHAQVQGEEVLLNAFYVNPQRGFVQVNTRAAKNDAAAAGLAAAEQVL